MIEDDSDNADDSDQGQKVRFLKGDPHLPIFNWTDCEDDKEVVSILLNPTPDTVCKKMPAKCLISN